MTLVFKFDENSENDFIIKEGLEIGDWWNSHEEVSFSDALRERNLALSFQGNWMRDSGAYCLKLGRVKFCDLEEIKEETVEVARTRVAKQVWQKTV